MNKKCNEIFLNNLNLFFLSKNKIITKFPYVKFCVSTGLPSHCFDLLCLSRVCVTKIVPSAVLQSKKTC